MPVRVTVTPATHALGVAGPRPRRGLAQQLVDGVEQGRCDAQEQVVLALDEPYRPLTVMSRAGRRLALQGWTGSRFGTCSPDVERFVCLARTQG